MGYPLDTRISDGIHHPSKVACYCRSREESFGSPYWWFTGYTFIPWPNILVQSLQHVVK
ncbi:uncharacterized protein FFFS_16047 [Fusarium fujikuroi]|nr:uncharacterized protein FFFS_16047 [Fusarium fujikuroi]